VASGDIIDRPISDRVGDPLSVLRGLTDYLRQSPLIIVGDAAYKYKDEIANEETEMIFLKPGLNISSVLAQRAALLLKENQSAPAAPHYIRQSDAEIEWRRRQ
jgi:tRNA A37 threonylcarbamoyladenosine modification protein TsaB